tara:strand:- start:178 stop:3129 length:2952 start_codon:yes stop_codon:yes gene_type:complete
MDTLEKSQRDRASDVYQSAALAPLGMGKGTAIGHAYDVGGGYFDNPFPGVDPVMLAEAVEGGAALPLLVKAVPLAVKAAGQTAIARHLRQFASDETSGVVFRNMNDTQIDTLAGQIAAQHADVSRQAWNTSTARGAADIARGRMSARAGRELPTGSNREPTELFDPDAGNTELMAAEAALEAANPLPRTRLSEVMQRFREMDEAGIGVDGETLDGILRSDAANPIEEAGLYLGRVFHSHIDQAIIKGGGTPKIPRPPDPKVEAPVGPGMPSRMEGKGYTGSYREPRTGVERLMEEVRDVGPATDPIGHDADLVAWRDMARREREELSAAVAAARAEGTPEGMARAERLIAGDPIGLPDSDLDYYGGGTAYGPEGYYDGYARPAVSDAPGTDWAKNPDWEARWIAHDPRDVAAREALANEGYTLGYGDVDLESMDPGGEWWNAAGTERVPNPNTGRIDYFSDPDEVMPNLAGNRPAPSDPGPAVADAPGTDWTDVGPPTDPIPQPDRIVDPRLPKGRLDPTLHMSSGRGERRLIGGERDTFAWDIDPDWDDLIREYPTQVMREGIDDIVLKYQRDLEMGGTPTFEDDFMLLADRAGGVVPVDDLNQWGGVMDEAIEGVNARGPRSEDLTGDLSNPAHPDHYFPGENMTGRDMSEAEAFANRPPFTAKELRQRRINEEEGEAAMALLEEGARTDPPMPDLEPTPEQAAWLRRFAAEDAARSSAERMPERVRPLPEPRPEGPRPGDPDYDVLDDPAAGFVPEGTPSEYDAMAIQEAPPGGDLRYADDDAFEEAMQRLGIDPPEVATKTPGFMPDDPDLLRLIEEEGLSPRTPFYLSDEAYEQLPIAERQEIIALLDAMSEDELGLHLLQGLKRLDEATDMTLADTFAISQILNRIGPSIMSTRVLPSGNMLDEISGIMARTKRLQSGLDENIRSILDKTEVLTGDPTLEDFNVLLETARTLTTEGRHEEAQYILDILRGPPGDIPR